MLVPCLSLLPTTTKTHTYAQCVSVPWEGVQAERVMGSCRPEGDVNGLGGVCVCVCIGEASGVNSMRWGGGQYCPQAALPGNYMPAASSTTSWHAGFGPPRSLPYSSSPVPENSRLHFLASVLALTRKLAWWGHCSLRQHTHAGTHTSSHQMPQHDQNELTLYLPD